MIEDKRGDMLTRYEQVKKQIVTLPPVLTRLGTGEQLYFPPAGQGRTVSAGRERLAPSQTPHGLDVVVWGCGDQLSCREEPPSRVPWGKPWCHLFIIQGLWDLLI